jgi:PKHD-type hydroxylase
MTQLSTFFTVADVLSEGMYAQVLAAAREAPFRDGSHTAGRWDGQRKRNTQADSESIRPLCKSVMREVMTNRTLCNRALPHEAVQPILNRYRAGDGYGAHEDSPIQSGIRADLSFTLFLSEPASYDGGELVLGDGAAAVQLKLPARSLVCYASGTLHEVLPVRSGERLALVGWLQSMVRDAGRRELLFALRETTDALAQRDDVEHEVTTLSRLYGGLLRCWAFD